MGKVFHKGVHCVSIIEQLIEAIAGMQESRFETYRKMAPEDARIALEVDYAGELARASHLVVLAEKGFTVNPDQLAWAEAVIDTMVYPDFLTKEEMDQILKRLEGA